MAGLQVLILITGAHKAFALYKAIEEGVNHMWTVSAFQQHPRTIFVCDEDATLELRVKTVKYFKGTAGRPRTAWSVVYPVLVLACGTCSPAHLVLAGLMHVHNKLVDPVLSIKDQ